MKAITFNCQQNHDARKCLIISKNQLKQRLRDRGSPVSDDDPIPAATSSSTFGFPSRDEYAEFFDDDDDICRSDFYRVLLVLCPFLHVVVKGGEVVC